jgi:hypothetical protein
MWKAWFKRRKMLGMFIGGVIMTNIILFLLSADVFLALAVWEARK